MTKKILAATLFGLFAISSVAEAKAPEHFYNPKKNLHKDPNYAPGDYAAAESFNARTAFYASKAELVAMDDAGKAGRLITTGVGEVTFSAPKNETKSVLGYFRNYIGVAETAKGKLKKMTMLVDINSLDTAVPGRNNRITKIFFESFDAEKGTSTIVFDKFKGKSSLKALSKGGTVTAMGTIELNKTKKPITAKLKVKKMGNTWAVETVEAITLIASDYGYEKAAYALMKECNHKALGNKIDVKVKLFFR